MGIGNKFRQTGIRSDERVEDGGRNLLMIQNTIV